jgi:Glycosyl hydrolases family 16
MRSEGTSGGQFDEPFLDTTLDTSIWFPHYLPAWSSRDATRASYRLDGSALTLDVPVGHPVWCPGDHTPPLRVSGIQSGNWSGPVGTPFGQQRFREGQLVREEQERFEGWLPAGGRVAIRARMSLSPRSMAALWMSGFEDDAEQLRCGEICVFEIFGNALADGAEPSAEVGVGIKAFRDPALTQDFAAPRVPIDVTGFHTYAVDWDADEAVFTVDDQVVRRCPRPPTYPLQLMLAVFDFPEWSAGDDDHLVPELVVDRVCGG